MRHPTSIKCCCCRTDWKRLIFKCIYIYIYIISPLLFNLDLAPVLSSYFSICHSFCIKIYLNLSNRVICLLQLFFVCHFFIYYPVPILTTFVSCYVSVIYEPYFNLLGPEFFFILAHPVYKMWITQEPNKLELWNKLHFEEKKNGQYIPCLKYSVLIFVE